MFTKQPTGKAKFRALLSNLVPHEFSISHLWISGAVKSGCTADPGLATRTQRDSETYNTTGAPRPEHGDQTVGLNQVSAKSTPSEHGTLKAVSARLLAEC